MTVVMIMLLFVVDCTCVPVSSSRIVENGPMCLVWHIYSPYICVNQCLTVALILSTKSHTIGHVCVCVCTRGTNLIALLYKLFFLFHLIFPVPRSIVCLCRLGLYLFNHRIVDTHSGIHWHADQRNARFCSHARIYTDIS